MIYKNGIIKQKIFYENENQGTYTVIGDVIITNGIASNFSNSSYIDTNYSQTNVVTDLDIYLEIMTPDTFSDTDNRYILLGQAGNNLKSPQIEVHPTRFGYGLSTDTSSWTGNWNINYDVQVKTKYAIRLKLKDNLAKFYVNDALLNTTTISNGIHWSVPIRIGADTSGAYSWNGSVDLTTICFKVDGNIVLSGVDAYLQNDKAKIGKNFIASKSFYEI